LALGHVGVWVEYVVVVEEVGVRRQHSLHVFSHLEKDLIGGLTVPCVTIDSIQILATQVTSFELAKEDGVRLSLRDHEFERLVVISF
jgi:hypothetical protein